METLLCLIKRQHADEDFDVLEALAQSPDAAAWSSRIAEAEQILADKDQKLYWHDAAVVCYSGLSRIEDLPMPKMELVARLYACLIECPNLGVDGLADGENLVWSIAIDLKGVSYNSEWDPMADPEVRSFLNAMVN